MGLIKGSISLTRYRVIDPPSDISLEFISERLQNNAFLNIDHSTEQESMGWVEVLSPMSTEFEVPSFHFGPVHIFGLRVDTRKVSPKVIARYLAQAQQQAEAQTGKPLTAGERRDLKNQIHHDLLARTPVTTDVFEVCWFPKEEEVWLTANGTKVRERLEEMWRRTFSFGLLMKIPFVLAKELIPEELDAELDKAEASALLGGRSLES